MDNQGRSAGEELRQLSRLLFDAAASNWYRAIILDVIAVILSFASGVLKISGDPELVVAVLIAGLLIVAYYLRLRFDLEYDLAETMRRQSVLSEALDWPVSSVQMSDWRQKVGKNIRAKVESTSIDKTYYASRKGSGSKRLLEMTIESAFYTRHLYEKLMVWIWLIVIVFLVLSVFILTTALTRIIPDTIDLIIARAIYSIVPLIISVDLLGWALRLSRLRSTVFDIEGDLERLSGSDDVELSHVLRLVSEYNCQTVKGFPIHDWLFTRWHDEISELWQKRWVSPSS